MNIADRPAFPWGVSAIGVVVVGFFFVRAGFLGHGAWLVALAAVTLAAWTAVGIMPRDFGLGAGLAPAMRSPARWWLLRPAVGMVGIAAGALAMGETQALLMVPVAFLTVLLVSNDLTSLWPGIAGGVVAVVLVPIGCVAAGSSLEATLTYEAYLVVWVLLGYARRQSRISLRQRRELLEREQAVREEHARAALLADRQAAARDIHDVLAHSLGGLVIQLDAVEALLESGQTGRAAAKASDARALAADGLAEARRAVAALRSPEDAGAAGTAEPMRFAELAAAAAELLAAHRSLGGAATADIDLGDGSGRLAADAFAAFERALRESLSNARKHAAGRVVEVRLARRGEQVELHVVNDLADADLADTAPAPDASGDLPGATAGTALARSGGGHGLAGMAERFAALPDGAVAAGARAGRFEVRAAARVAPGPGAD